MTPHPTSQQILDTPMERNDSGNDTIRGYIIALALKVWQERDMFSGKRPFGNSGWQYDIYKALAKAGHIQATFDEDDYIEDLTSKERYKADTYINRAIASLS